MISPVDPVIISALCLNTRHDIAVMAPLGGSSFSRTFKLSVSSPGGQLKQVYFVKIGSGKDSELMYRGEHASLNAIHDAIPTFCPKSYAHGALSSTRSSSNSHSTSYFLITDFLSFGSDSSNTTTTTTATLPKASGLSLAAKLARLHTTSAPIPEGFDRPMFGFPVATCCGDTPQDNSWRDSWSDFYAENRLCGAYRAMERNHGVDQVVKDAVEKTASKVVPRLIGRVKNIRPVIIHGDLWSGNHSKGRIGLGDGAVEELVYDAAAVYGHSEYELGIMNMFGGFGSQFWREYEQLVPKAEPVDEWEDRLKLYELYHHLNHCAIFGRGYRNGAMSIIEELISKYADQV